MQEKERDQAGSKRLDFKEYKRQRNLKLLEEIAQVEKSSILNDGDDAADDGTFCPLFCPSCVFRRKVLICILCYSSSSSPVHEKAEDTAFLLDLEASIKNFVTALIKFKTVKEKAEKDNYLTSANGVLDEATSIAKKVDTKMSDLKVELDSDLYKLKAAIHNLVVGMGAQGSELLTRVNLSRGVWPPPNAEANMMEAALAMASTVKELVNSTKTAVLEYQEVRLPLQISSSFSFFPQLAC